MKKIYLKPNTKCKSIESLGLMENSPIHFDDATGGGSVNVIEEDAEGPVMGKNSLWFSEDE